MTKKHTHNRVAYKQKMTKKAVCVQGLYARYILQSIFHSTLSNLYICTTNRMLYNSQTPVRTKLCVVKRFSTDVFNILHENFRNFLPMLPLPPLPTSPSIPPTGSFSFALSFSMCVRARPVNTLMFTYTLTHIHAQNISATKSSMRPLWIMQAKSKRDANTSPYTTNQKASRQRSELFERESEYMRKMCVHERI